MKNDNEKYCLFVFLIGSAIGSSIIGKGTPCPISGYFSPLVSTDSVLSIPKKDWFDEIRIKEISCVDATYKKKDIRVKVEKKVLLRVPETLKNSKQS